MTDADAARNGSLFALLREISREWEFHHRESENLRPLPGERPMGGAHFDAFLRAEAAREFLTGVRLRWTPEEAAAGAKKLVHLMIKRWNEHPDGVFINGPYELKRPPCMADAQIDGYALRVAKVMTWALCI